MALQKTLWQQIVDLISNGQSVSDQLDTAFTNVDAAITQIDTNTASIEHLNDTGMTVMAGSNIASQTIGATPTKVTSFDTVTIDVGFGTSASIPLQRMTATSDGVDKLRYEAFVSYASNVDIEWQIYKNGSPFGNSITLSGQGTGVFPIVLISAAELLENDYLELFATASASASLDISQANGTLEKTHF